MARIKNRQLYYDTASRCDPPFANKKSKNEITERRMLLNPSFHTLSCKLVVECSTETTRLLQILLGTNGHALPEHQMQLPLIL